MSNRKEKKSRDEIEASVARFTEIVRSITSIIQLSVKGIIILGCFFFIYKSISSLAGLDTNANIVLQVLTDLKANQWFGYVVGGGGLVYGIRERRLRQRNIKRMAERTDKLEKAIDPQKNSSYLSMVGEARMEDA
jgi:hypothetical protein